MAVDVEVVFSMPVLSFRNQASRAGVARDWSPVISIQLRVTQWDLPYSVEKLVSIGKGKTDT
jgi:hypothetical protein